MDAEWDERDAIAAVMEVEFGKRHRGSLVPRQRLSWDQHELILQREGSFQRVYRMSLATFDRLVELLTPQLIRCSHMADLRNGLVTPRMQVIGL